MKSPLLKPFLNPQSLQLEDQIERFPYSIQRVVIGKISSVLGGLKPPPVYRTVASLLSSCTRWCQNSILIYKSSIRNQQSGFEIRGNFPLD